MTLTVVFLLMLLIAVQSFVFPTWMNRGTMATSKHIAPKQTKSILFARKEMDFSDIDLDEDDIDIDIGYKSSKKKRKTPDVDLMNVEKFLAENWSLDTPMKDDIDLSAPVFGMVYLFADKYLKSNIENEMEEHNEFCAKVSKLLYSKEYAMDGKRGMSLIWVGQPGDDLQDTKAEIQDFISRDPLMQLKIVESWELFDMNEGNEDGDEEDDEDPMAFLLQEIEKMNIPEDDEVETEKAKE